MHRWESVARALAPNEAPARGPSAGLFELEEGAAPRERPSPREKPSAAQLALRPSELLLAPPPPVRHGAKPAGPDEPALPGSAATAQRLRPEWAPPRPARQGRTAGAPSAQLRGSAAGSRRLVEARSARARRTTNATSERSPRSPKKKLPGSRRRRGLP